MGTDKLGSLEQILDSLNPEPRNNEEKNELERELTTRFLDKFSLPTPFLSAYSVSILGKPHVTRVAYSTCDPRLCVDITARYLNNTLSSLGVQESFVGLVTSAGNVTLKGTMYYEEEFAFPFNASLSGNLETTRRSIHVGIQNCMDVAGVINKTRYKCPVCGSYLKVRRYGPDNYYDDLKKRKNEGRRSLFAVRSALYKQTKHLHICGDLKTLSCPACSLKLGPYDTLDRCNRESTVHPTYNCYCGSDLRYVMDGSGKLVFRCSQCGRLLEQEEALAVFLSGDTKKKAVPW